MMSLNRNPFNSFTILIFILFSTNINNYAQNIKEARKTIESLASKEFYGRGYTNDGAKNASVFIAQKLKKSKLKPFGIDYFQEFNISINTFPAEMKLALNNKSLVPGYDFLVDAKSNSIIGEFPVIVMDHNLVDFPENLKKIKKEQFQESFLLIDTSNLKNKGFKDAVSGIIGSNLFGAKGIIEIEYKNLMYSPSSFEQPFPIVKIMRNAIPENLQTISLNIKNQFYTNYTTNNIVAYIQGDIDSFIVFSAHYDHLGEMGKDVFFPGANDNASGVSMVLDLANSFAQRKEKPKYSMAFLFFSAEELGLLGSVYYTQNPLFPLSKIKFLINLDLVGSGEKGITVVNGTIFKKEFDKLVDLNRAKSYLKEVAFRGPAANSDHYPFYVKGVNSFYIYTRGEYSEYHSIYDKPEGLPLFEYEDLHRLLTDFVNSF